MPRPRTAWHAIRLGLRLAMAAPLVWAAAAHAQPAAAPRGASETNGAATALPDSSKGPSSPSLVEQPPRILYAPDAEGNPVPLINVPLTTIQRLLDQQDGLLVAQQPPAFEINQLGIRGTVRGPSAELDVDLQVTVLMPAEGEPPIWTALPLRFHDASLLAPPEYEGDGELHLNFDAEAGYQGWLRHQRPGQHRIRLKMAVPLGRAAESTRLSFFPPLANQSQLELSVPMRDITADVENARNLSVEAAEGEQSLLRADDLRNEVVLSWRQGTPAGQEPPTYLDVRGDLRVTIDGPGAIRSNATLDLQSYGRPIEQFSLRLPPNTKIVSGSQPDYSISELSNADADLEANRATVQIKLEKPAPTARIQLVTQTTDRAEAMTSVNVANFEVIGAIRQSGRVSLVTSEEWLVYWTLGPSVRRVANVESFETTQERKQLASFQYFRQPCRLDVQIQPQGTRIGVQPTYRMRVTEDRIALEAQLDYKIRGARVSFLNFALNGWQLDDVGPSGAVENDDFRSGGTDPIKLRLTQATSGDLALTLNLHRPMQGGQGTLRLPLPWPGADATTPGALFISSADSVVLNFRLQEMAGLVQDPLLAGTMPPPAVGPDPATPVTAFRFMADRALGEVVMDYEIRARELRVRMDSVIELSTDTAQVSQRWAYRILYEPATRLTFQVPQPLYELLSNPRYRNLVELRLDGQALGPDAYQDLLDAAQDTRERQLVPLNLRLDRARLGPLNLELRYAWPLSPLGTAEYTPIPLATPSEAEVISNTATLTPVGPLRVEPSDDGNWSRDDDVISSNSLQAVGMTSPSRPNLLRVRVAQRRDEAGGDEAVASATVVERAWLQTWLADDQRMDRAVFRVFSGADRVVLQLPEGIEQTIALVDGREVAAVPTDRELTVPMPRTSSNEHTLEVSLTFGDRPPLGEMRFAPPVLRDAVGPRRWFWQLLVPADEHLLWADSRLTSANRWTRVGWFWRREAAQPQPRLEYWTGAIQQPALPDGLNEYLFSSFDHMDPLHVRTCRRRALVLASSATALGIGLALLYWPAMRHPAVLLVLALALFAASWLFTDVALLVSQACLLGIALALLASLLSLIVQHFGARETAPPWIGRPATDSRSGASSAWGDGSAPHSTVPGPTLPAIVPDSKA